MSQNRIDEIMALPVERRLPLLLDLYENLDEFTGCRSADEHNAMKRIADMVMPELIRDWRNNNQWQPE